jgi:hypothetical protein
VGRGDLSRGVSASLGIVFCSAVVGGGRTPDLDAFESQTRGAAGVHWAHAGVGRADLVIAGLGFWRMERRLGGRGCHGRFFAGGGDDDEFRNANCCF